MSSNPTTQIKSAIIWMPVRGELIIKCLLPARTVYEHAIMIMMRVWDSSRRYPTHVIGGNHLFKSITFDLQAGIQ